MSIVSVSCGHAHEKYGHKFNVVRRINAGGHGWTHDFSFKAFENQAPNTIPICVGYHRSESIYIIKMGLSAAEEDWIHDTCVFVYPVKYPGTQPYTVSYARESKLRYRISRGEGLSALDKYAIGFKESFIFWTYPENGRWFPPAYDGPIPGDGNGAPASPYPSDTPRAKGACALDSTIAARDNSIPAVEKGTQVRSTSTQRPKGMFALRSRLRSSFEK